MQMIRLTVGLTLVTAQLALGQNEEIADNRQQQLINEAVRSQSVRNFRSVISEDAGQPGKTALKKEKLTDFQVGLLQDLEYQSNANLDGNGGSGSFSYSPTVFFRSSTKIREELRFSTAASWGSTWYSDLDERDFWGLTGQVQLNYRPAKRWPEFYAGPELNRYEQWDGGDEISKSISAVVGLRNTVKLGPKTNLFYNIRYAHRWIDPSQFERDQVNVLVGFTQRLAKGLFLQPSYSFGWYDYEDGFGLANVDREDLRHELALALVYRLNENFSFRLSGSFVDNDSSFSRANYQNFSTGLNSGIVYGF
jgi:hypothetical protein